MFVCETPRHRGLLQPDELARRPVRARYQPIAGRIETDIAPASPNACAHVLLSHARTWTTDGKAARAKICSATNSQAELIFIKTRPLKISSAATTRARLNDSPKSTMPSTKLPMTPIPVQIA